MPDEATTKWQSVLEILSDSTELSTGKLSIIRLSLDHKSRRQLYSV